MTKIALLLLLVGPLTFASDFFERDLDHLDRILVGSDLSAEGTYTVQYPGLGSQGFEHPDCLILNFGRAFPSAQQIERLKERIVVSDGDGVLFTEPTRNVNVLDPVEIRLGAGQGRLALAFYLKDLSRYVTGVSIKAFSPYLSVHHILRREFGENGAREVEFIFLRGCKL